MAEDDFYSEENDNNIRFLIRVCAEPFQELLDVFNQLRFMRWLSSATGAQLDMIGKILILSRDGFDDTNYRRLLRAKVAVLRSSGNVEDIIKITKLVLDDPTAQIIVTNWETAAATVQIAGVALDFHLATVLISLLRKAIGIGIKLVLVFDDSITTPRFRYKRFDGTFTDGTGFEKFDGTPGGRLADALV